MIDFIWLVGIVGGLGLMIWGLMEGFDHIFGSQSQSVREEQNGFRRKETQWTKAVTATAIGSEAYNRMSRENSYARNRAMRDAVVRADEVTK